MGFLFVLFVIVVGGCWKLGRTAGRTFFTDRDNSTYIDKSTTVIHNHHHHYHDNRSVHVDGDQLKDLK